MSLKNPTLAGRIIYGLSSLSMAEITCIAEAINQEIERRLTQGDFYVEDEEKLVPSKLTERPDPTQCSILGKTSSGCPYCYILGHTDHFLTAFMQF